MCFFGWKAPVLLGFFRRKVLRKSSFLFIFVLFLFLGTLDYMQNRFINRVQNMMSLWVLTTLSGPVLQPGLYKASQRVPAFHSIQYLSLPLVFSIHFSLCPASRQGWVIVLMGLYLDTNVQSADSGQQQQPGLPPEVRPHHH